MIDDDWKDYLCKDGSDEHDYEVTSEDDDLTILVCATCGAETWEPLDG